MCLPAIGAVFGAVSSIAGAVGGHQQQQAQADYANQVAARDYKYAVAKRDAEWKQTLSIWGSKRVDYRNQSSENHSAAGRAYAAEQNKLNESYMQAAFQQQAALAQLIQGRGGLAASGRSGKSVAKMDQAMLAAYGSNNSKIAANLTSARNAMMRRNDETRNQLMSANNKAWSEVALKPIPGMAPPQPIMQAGPSGLGLAAGILGGISQGIGAFSSLKAPDAGNFGAQNYNFNQGPTDSPYFGPAFGNDYTPYTPKATTFNSFGINTFGR